MYNFVLLSFKTNSIMPSMSLSLDFLHLAPSRPFISIISIFMQHVSHAFVTSHVILRHPKHDASKNVQISTVWEFDEIRRVSYISRDDSNGEICFVIRDLEKFRVLTEITILPFFQKLKFSRVLHSPLLKRNFVPKFWTITTKHMHMQRALYHACKLVI